MAGVSNTGFEAKRLADVLAEASEELATIVDPGTGETLQPEFGSDDPAMQIVQVPLDGVALAWEAAQVVYDQFDPTKARGPSLRGLVELNGLSRQPATASTVALLLSGVPNTLIPAGQLVADVNNTGQWVTTETVAIGTDGTATSQARQSVVGPIAALPGTLVNRVTTVPGWVSVTNPAAAIVGRFAETDTELRQRRARSTMAPAASPVESVYANLGNIPGVSYVRVYQNNTLTVDSRGIAPKSVAAVVVGGADADVAFTLLERTGVSADWFGTSALTLYDAQNEPYVVRWTRPAPMPIYIRLRIQIINPALFPVDGIQQIKDAIKAYAQGGAPALGIDEGFAQTGFPPGSLVSWSRLFTPINYVPGALVRNLSLGTAPNPTTEGDVQTPWNQYPQFTDENIDIEVV